jgi:hypothetical protein
MTDTVKVLNGTVQAGDTVAYATRGGSSMDMSIGTVLEVTEGPHPYRYGETSPVLRLQVTQSTDSYTLPREVKVKILDRVVKVNA